MDNFLFYAAALKDGAEIRLTVLIVSTNEASRDVEYIRNRRVDMSAFGVYHKVEGCIFSVIDLLATYRRPYFLTVSAGAVIDLQFTEPPRRSSFF